MKGVVSVADSSRMRRAGGAEVRVLSVLRLVRFGAEEEVVDSGIERCRMRLPLTRSWADWKRQAVE